MIKQTIAGIGIAVIAGGTGFLASDITKDKEDVVSNVAEIVQVQDIDDSKLRKEYSYTTSISGDQVISERTYYDDVLISFVFYDPETLSSQLSSGRINSEKKTELENVISTLEQ